MYLQVTRKNHPHVHLLLIVLILIYFYHIYISGEKSQKRHNLDVTRKMIERERGEKGVPQGS